MPEFEILDKINSPDDIKKLPETSLTELCDEIRQFLIETVSKTGGHLASNLGIVEITVAIHRVFNTATDRLIFDVGHQCYVHKMLTGRREGMSGLRKSGGIAGFPRPDESEHDAFIAGHASTSISAALGFARASSLLNKDNRTVALIGDGALTGGLAYEGLNDAGTTELPLVIIYNDNGMSIAKNVGGMSRKLSNFRIRKNYIKAKKAYHRVMRVIPFGKHIHRFFKSGKDAIRKIFVPGTFFENMGLKYIGPINGHDINMLTYSLRLARDMNMPVVVHAVTKKGKGYTPSELSPDNYHGINAVKPDDADKTRNEDSFSSVFGRHLCDLASDDSRICAVTAAMPAGTGLDGFMKMYPERFFDVGIAEAHAVTMSAGMAKQGMRPVCAIYSTFLQRAYDQIIHDASILSLPVIFAVDRAGLTGEDGETHNGVFDISFLTSIPDMCFYFPASYAELRTMLAKTIDRKTGPSAIRYPRGAQGKYSDCRIDTRETVLRAGTQITLVSYGILINNASEASEILQERGICAEVIKINYFDGAVFSETLASLRKTKRLAVVEDCVKNGSIGEKIAAACAKSGLKLDVCILLDTGDGLAPAASVSTLYERYRLTPEAIANRICDENQT